MTVAAVLDAGLDTFLQRGFHQASIHDITAAAGLTRGAFYSNFPTKEALFLAIYDRRTDQMLTELGGVLERTPAGGDAVPLLLEYAANGGAGGDDWFLALAEFTLHAARHADLAAQFSEHKARFITKLSALLATVVASTNRPPETDTGELATAIVALYEGTAMMRVITPRDGKASAMFERMAAVILDALTPPRAKQ